MHLKKLCLVLILPLGLFPWTAAAVGQSSGEADVGQESQAEVDQDQAEPTATPTGDEADGEAQDPNWFQAMLARSVEPLPLIEVATADGVFRASIPAKMLKPVEKTDDAYVMTIDFGPGDEAPAYCFAFTKELDLASSLEVFSRKFFSDLPAPYGPPTAAAIYRLDAGGVGPWPYIGLDWLYRSEPEGGEPLAGHVKHLIAAKDGRPIYCQNSTAGYDDAFFNLFQNLVSTATFSTEILPELYYRDLSLIRINDQVVGVSLGMGRFDSDGDVEYRLEKSMLVPTSAGTVVANDSVSLRYSTKAGALISAFEVELENGRVVTQMSLNESDDGAWQVAGHYEGQEINAQLGDEAPYSDLQKRLAMRELAAGAKKDAAVTFKDWLPRTRPGEIAETTVTYLGEEESALGSERGHGFEIVSGTVSTSAVADENMSSLSMSYQLGEWPMSFEQLFSHGDIFHPLTLATDGAE